MGLRWKKARYVFTLLKRRVILDFQCQQFLPTLNRWARLQGLDYKGNPDMCTHLHRPLHQYHNNCGVFKKCPDCKMHWRKNYGKDPANGKDAAGQWVQIGIPEDVARSVARSVGRQYRALLARSVARSSAASSAQQPPSSPSLTDANAETWRLWTESPESPEWTVSMILEAFGAKVESGRAGSQADFSAW